MYTCRTALSNIIKCAAIVVTSEETVKHHCSRGRVAVRFCIALIAVSYLCVIH